MKLKPPVWFVGPCGMSMRALVAVPKSSRTRSLVPPPALVLVKMVTVSWPVVPLGATCTVTEGRGEQLGGAGGGVDVGVLPGGTVGVADGGGGIRVDVGVGVRVAVDVAVAVDVGVRVGVAVGEGLAGLSLDTKASMLPPGVGWAAFSTGKLVDSV